MKKFISAYWKQILFFALLGLVGGFFTGLYSFETLTGEMLTQLVEQGVTKPILGVISAIQAMLYGIGLGSIGIILSKKVGLGREDFKFEKKALIDSIIVSFIGGLALILLDVFFFANYSQVIDDSYLVKPTISYLIAMLTYAPVIEEVMLRLFFMSLIAFILHKFFEKEKEETSTKVIVVANILAALLFAAGHLPATSAMMTLTPMIIFRCFLLNGGVGLLFGWLYRKHGIYYAMIAHGGCHVVSKLIWILFI